MDKEYNYIDHPKHYNRYEVEVIEMIDRIWGHRRAMEWCEITAFKYRMRMGTKPGEPIERDLSKENFYLAEKEKYSKLLKEELDKKYNKEED